MANKGIDWSSLWKKEDWWAVWMAAVLVILAIAKGIVKMPRFGRWTGDPMTALAAGTIPLVIMVGVVLLVITLIVIAVMKENVKAYLAGFPLIYILCFLAMWLAPQKSLNAWGLEHVLWALIFGLIVSNIFGVPKWLKAAAKTELFIKIGLVLLGAEILFHTIMKAGALGMTQAVVVVLLVWYFCYWLGKKMGLSDSFGSILATGVSVCGVSAAIAAGGAIKGDSKEVSYTISLVLLCAMPMLVGMPILAKMMGLSEGVAGAWLGGTIDTTGAVVAAGAIYGKIALEAAAIVKMSQNVLIGAVAFILAIWFTFKVERKPGEEKPRAAEIWYRFPKFIVGFVVLSAVFSLILVPSMGEPEVKKILAVTSGFRGWLFALAFVAIGIETRFVDLVKVGGGKPVVVFLVAQVFNIFLTLALAYLLFGGVLFESPFKG
jgi:uncharacterized integral membrane protein (TIGR00698 family)